MKEGRFAFIRHVESGTKFVCNAIKEVSKEVSS